MANSTNGTTTPLRVFVFDNLRVRSHIFSRLFSQHPRLTQIYHPYLLSTTFGPEQTLRLMKHSEARDEELSEWLAFMVPETRGSASRDLEKSVLEIEKSGRSAWVSEHCPFAMRHEIVHSQLRGHEYTPHDLGSNPTQIPDWLFETCKPVIVIRHPAKMVVSFHRAMSPTSCIRPSDEDFSMATSLHYARMLFDLFQSQGRKPIVVDGDDVVLRTRDMINGVCNALGIDPAGVKEKWDPTPEDQRPENPFVASFTKTMHDSTGVERRPTDQPTETIDVDQEIRKATKDFGEDIGNQLRGHIEQNMADYEYVRLFKV